MANTGGIGKSLKRVKESGYPSIGRGRFVLSDEFPDSF
jgi:hypothetical protein